MKHFIKCQFLKVTKDLTMKEVSLKRFCLSVFVLLYARVNSLKSVEYAEERERERPQTTSNDPSLLYI